MTGGKFDIGVENGRLAIRRDGAFRKFVPQVGQISFSASLAAQRGQHVSYITERAVFELENGSVTLTEIAPGVRLEEDILAHMGFKPRISPQLRDMDPRIFRFGSDGDRAELQGAAGPAAQGRLRGTHGRRAHPSISVTRTSRSAQSSRPRLTP